MSGVFHHYCGFKNCIGDDAFMLLQEGMCIVDEEMEEDMRDVSEI
jgi:hypothetical protein